MGSKSLRSFWRIIKDAAADSKTPATVTVEIREKLNSFEGRISSRLWVIYRPDGRDGGESLLPVAEWGPSSGNMACYVAVAEKVQTQHCFYTREKHSNNSNFYLRVCNISAVCRMHSNICNHGMVYVRCGRNHISFVTGGEHSLSVFKITYIL